MSEIYQLPDNNGGNNGTNIPFSIPIGLGNMFALGILSSLFNGGGFGTMPMPKLEEKDFETEIENKAK